MREGLGAVRTDRLKGRRTLTIYLTAGDPLAFSDPVIDALVSSDIDLFELGIPNEHPKYDGPTIRESYKRALENGVTVEKVFEIIKNFPSNKVLFTYFDLALKMGLEEFANLASGCSVGSMLFPDMLIDYPGRLDSYVRVCGLYGLEPAFFVTSSFPHRLISKVAKLEPAFIYLGLMASTGILLPVTLSRTIRIVKELIGDVPLFVGFAISRPEQIANCVNAGADGVVIGSAVLRLLKEAEIDERPRRVKEYIRSLKMALDGAYT